MTTTTISDFLTMLLSSVKTNKSLKYTIFEYNGKNIFTVKEKHGNVVYLEINQDNKYDFILDEIKKAFPDQYKIFSMHDISGHNQIYFTIKNVCISFDYSLQDGQNWMYRIANEL